MIIGYNLNTGYLEEWVGTSLVVQWSRTHVATQDTGSILSQGTEIPHAWEQLSPHAATTEAHALWSPCPTTGESVPRHERPHVTTKPQCSQVNKYFCKNKLNEYARPLFSISSILFKQMTEKISKWLNILDSWVGSGCLQFTLHFNEVLTIRFFIKRWFCKLLHRKRNHSN